MHINIEDELKNIQSIENLIQNRAQSDVFTQRTLYTFSFNELIPLFELLDNYKEILESFREQATSKVCSNMTKTEILNLLKKLRNNDFGADAIYIADEAIKYIEGNCKDRKEVLDKIQEIEDRIQTQIVY